MNPVLQIDDEYISAEEFIGFLKLNNEFPDLMDKLIRNKITVHAAKKKGITVSREDMQQAADDYRRCFGLHRAKETQEWMDSIGITPEDFEAFIAEMVYRKKMNDAILSQESVEEYFRLNAPLFDTADIRHIVVQSEAKAREIIALLEEEPERFEEFVLKYSLDDESKAIGGSLTGIRRGMLPPEIEDRVFNGAENEIIGPYTLNGNQLYEIIRIITVHRASLNDTVREKISETVFENWLAQRFGEHRICMDDRKLRFN